MNRSSGDQTGLNDSVSRNRRGGQPHVCFVDKRCRLKRVARPLPRHLSPRQPSQLVVDDRKELLQRGLVAVFPSGEEMRDVMAGHIGHGDRPRITSLSQDGNLLDHAGPTICFQACIESARMRKATFICSS